MGRIGGKEEKEGQERKRIRLIRVPPPPPCIHGRRVRIYRHEPYLTNLNEHKETEPRRYETQSRRSLLAQCTLRASPGLRGLIRNVKGIASPSSALTTPKTGMIETTPASDNLNLVVPPAPQVSTSTTSISRSNQVESSKTSNLPPTRAGIEEVDPALVTVLGYRVKEEVAPLLRSILLKYGDIAKHNSLQSVKGLSMHLEMMCDIYLNLEKMKNLKDVASWEIEIKGILAEVADLEAAKLDVGWLRKRLEDISKALEERKRYKAWKDEGARKNVREEMLVKELEESRKRTQQQEFEFAIASSHIFFSACAAAAAAAAAS